MNTDLDPLVVKETQEVKWCKVNALLSIQYDFVAGRSAARKFLISYCAFLIVNTMIQR